MAEAKKRIQLGSSLAIAVAERLRKRHGIDAFSDYSIQIGFDPDVLAKIDTLTLKNISSYDLKGLEHFPNLKNLHIVNNISQESQVGSFTSITDSDIMTISKCKNLKFLTIENQAALTKIDLSQFPQLRDIKICNNPQLKIVEGVDKLSQLNSLVCYGNESLWDFPKLHEAIKKCDLWELNLDVNLFPQAINYNFNTGAYDQAVVSKLDARRQDVKWTQNTYSRETMTHNSTSFAIKINHAQMLNLHNKACQILNGIISSSIHKSDIDKILAVEQYLARNVVYDHGSLKNGNTHTIDGPSTIDGSKGLLISDGLPHGANSAYNCLMKGTCVCQGYSRGEQYLLALMNIRSTAISCVGERDTIGIADSQKTWDNEHEVLLARQYIPDHSILRIDDYYSLYSDPCWNANSWQKGDKSMHWSLRTKREISRDHTLLRFDRDIVSLDGMGLRISPKRIEQSISTNELFARTKTSEVEEQRKQLGAQKPVFVRGMIPDGRA